MPDYFLECRPDAWPEIEESEELAAPSKFKIRCFPQLSNPEEASNFTQVNGVFHLVACCSNSWDNIAL